MPTHVPCWSTCSVRHSRSSASRGRPEMTTWSASRESRPLRGGKVCAGSASDLAASTAQVGLWSSPGPCRRACEPCRSAARAFPTGQCSMRCSMRSTHSRRSTSRRRRWASRRRDSTPRACGASAPFGSPRRRSVISGRATWRTSGRSPSWSSSTSRAITSGRRGLRRSQRPTGCRTRRRSISRAPRQESSGPGRSAAPSERHGSRG